MPPKTVITFDLYGTLLSTSSISKELAKFFGEETAARVAAQARTYQLEYTWRANSMGVHTSFSELTRWSFRQAATEAGVKLSPDQEQQLIDSYNNLDTFPDVTPALDLLSKNPSIDPFVFSNGTLSMVTASLSTSPQLSAASHILPGSKAISVESLKVFKPDRRTYEYAVETVGMKGQPGKVWLVSSNAFDALGAVAAGMKSVWVDRAGFGWTDGLGGAMGKRPTIVAKGVDEAVREIIRLSSDGLRGGD